MHVPESRQIRLPVFLRAIACSLVLLTLSGGVFGEEQTSTSNLASRIVGRLRDPIVPHDRTVCSPVMMEGIAKSRGFTGKVLIAADPQARLTTIQVTDTGPANFAIGVSGSRVWLKDAGGVVSDVDSDNDRAGLVSDAYWASGGLMNACWHADVRFLKSDKVGGVSADVLEVVPQGGEATQVWVSRKTQLPLRWTRQDQPDVATTSYSGYGRGRTEGIPLKQSLVDRDGNRWDLTIKKVRTDADPAAVAAKVQKPGQDVADHWIDEGDSTTVPMRMAGQPHVDVYLDGKGPFNFLLDTGGALTLSAATAKAMKLKLLGKVSVKGPARRMAPAKFARIEDLRIGTAHLRDQYTTVLDSGPASLARLDPQTAGVIGYEVLARFTTTFDFPKQQVTLSLAPVSALTDGRYVLPLMLDRNIPVVPGTINGISDYLRLDTGYSGTLSINPWFAKAHAQAMPQRLYDTAVSTTGVSGGDNVKRGQIPVLTIGASSFADIIASFPNVPASSGTNPEYAADVGDTIFSASAVTFDYRGRRVSFKPSDTTVQPSVAHYNRAGFGLQYVNGAVAKVSYVRDGSPAAEVGLQKGDQVIDINQQSISDDVVAAVTKHIEAEDNDPIQLLVLRDGKVTEFNVQPRAYMQ